MRPARKSYVTGTHRVRSPDETWSWVEPILPSAGVTRVADVTWLDDLGIPVFQAIRPDSRMLSVSQGKGLTPAAARVSAAMESLELWHAERVEEWMECESARVGDVVDMLGFRLDELLLAPGSSLNPDSRLEWVTATRLDGRGSSLVPIRYLSLDGRLDDRWRPPLFEPTSNGLASGNTLEEAIVHGLYEVIERDALARCGTDQRVPITFDGGASAVVGDLLGRFHRAGVRVHAELLCSPIDVPCFVVQIWSADYGVVFQGSGAHLDREVALCRALTEAAQSRLTAIGGTREDLRPGVYGRASQPPRSWAVEDRIALGDVPSLQMDDLGDEVRLLVSRITDVTGRVPLVVDHTRTEIGVPVARVVGPGLRYPVGY